VSVEAALKLRINRCLLDLLPGPKLFLVSENALAEERRRSHPDRPSFCVKACKGAIAETQRKHRHTFDHRPSGLNHSWPECRQRQLSV